jgi:hypothetical protein
VGCPKRWWWNWIPSIVACLNGLASVHYHPHPDKSAQHNQTKQ